MKTSAILLVATFVSATAVPEVRANEMGQLLLVVRSDSSPRVRAQAILALSTKANIPEVSRTLVSMLDDGDPIVRAAALRALFETAPEDSYKSVCRAVQDPDELVAKWARILLQRLVARARTVDFSIRGIRSSMEFKPDLSQKIFQEVVLENLLKQDRFDVSAKMNFGSTMGVAREVVHVRIDLSGDVRVTGINGDEVEVTAILRAVAPHGYVIWEGDTLGRGMPGESPPRDPRADEYLIPVHPDDARIVALRKAAESLTGALIRVLAEDPSAGDLDRRHLRKKWKRRNRK